VPVSGTVAFPSSVKLAENDTVSVGFVPAGGGQGITAKFNNADQSFNFEQTAETLGGIPPGKYKIVVKVTPYAGMPGSDKRKSALDPLNKKFDADASPLTYEVAPGENKVVIDLTKGTVTKS